MESGHGSAVGIENPLQKLLLSCVRSKVGTLCFRSVCWFVAYTTALSGGTHMIHSCHPTAGCLNTGALHRRVNVFLGRASVLRQGARDR